MFFLSFWGFLITGIMTEELAASSFSTAAFYSRRIRRIFPTLIVVMLSVLAVGYCLLNPASLELIGKDIAAGSVFGSNLLLAYESGYFEAEYISNPFLHLWSLGIEEQFYIVWPLLIFAFRKSKRNLLLVLLGLSLASFAYSILILNVRPEAAFLSPLSRFWELSVGGILSLSLGKKSAWRTQVISNALACVGLLAILFSFSIASSGRSIPGFWAFYRALCSSASTIKS